MPFMLWKEDQLLFEKDTKGSHGQVSIIARERACISWVLSI
jgi:hypothetical protein